jgi:hypothetical protein
MTLSAPFGSVNAVEGDDRDDPAGHRLALGEDRQALDLPGEHLVPLGVGVRA